MFNTIVQVLLGLIYGLYLAFLAPASQRQKAMESLKQHTVVPTVQEKAMLSQIEISAAEPAEEPIPLTSETKCKMLQGEGKHQNTLSGVPIEQQAVYTCVETRRKSALVGSRVQIP